MPNHAGVTMDYFMHANGAYGVKMAPGLTSFRRMRDSFGLKGRDYSAEPCDGIQQVK